jgi:alpha-amylase/alpha-mannosidase (GH57 family)
MIQTGVVTRAGTWRDEDGDAKAWQGEDEDREARNQR